MRKILMKSTILAALVVGVAGGGYWWQQNRYLESTDNAYVEGDISVISPRIEGYVAAVKVADNEAVKAGDVLVTIEDSDFRARLAQAAATVDAATASISTIDSQIAYQLSRITQVAAQQQSAGAELDRAKSVHDRYKKLVADKIIGTQEMDEATASYLKAQADISRLGAALAAEKTQLGVYQASRQEAVAKLEEVKAAYDLAANDLAKTVIRAPIDGVVGNRGVRVGQYVKPGTQMLSLVPTEVHVVANFKETQIENMRPGQKVALSVDAFPSEKLVGEVDSFAPASGSEFSLLPAENATGNFTKIVRRVPVRISVPADSPLHGLLRPGLSVVVAVDTKSGPAADAQLTTNGSWLFGSAIAGEGN